MKFIKKFKELRIDDVSIVGGKNASLGEMIGQLASKGVAIPDGFATTVQAYWYFLEYNDLLGKIREIMGSLQDFKDNKQLKKVGSEIRGLISGGVMPPDLQSEIERAYQELCNCYRVHDCDVAVRSSATAEDLPTASFAGQQETFLNVRGAQELTIACKNSMASLFTDRAIIYRIEKGFNHFDVALSVGVQKMIRSDLSAAGVIFTLDTETGFRDVVMINSSWGLGEIVVKGEVIPDEFLVHKPTFKKGYKSIIKKSLGDKTRKIIYSNPSVGSLSKAPLARVGAQQGPAGQAKDRDAFTKAVHTSEQEKNNFSLKNNEILELAKYALIIEEYYSQVNNRWSPMDIEWAKDGNDGKLYILQARPETVHAIQSQRDFLEKYKLKNSEYGNKQKVLVTGQSIGNKIVAGKAHVITSVKDIDKVKEGDIIVTQMTDPDWVPAMRKASGIITERGGRTCHAAIVSRELNIPAIVGAQDALIKIKTGQEITVDCSRGKTGYVYQGHVPFEVINIPVGKLSTSDVPCQVMVNIADPDSAFTISFLPNDGVGLARLEFVINNFIQIHPMVCIKPEKITDPEINKKIDFLTRAYKNKKSFFIDSLAYGISTIASAFYPKPVIVRLSDFKTNEYRNLIGGKYFEPIEQNPMLGWRGASRYYHPEYKDAFALECQAIKKAREEIGLTNLKIMVPFVRTVYEAEKVMQELAKNNLYSQSNNSDNNLEIIMMCEVPSNVILIEEFCKLFHGFSIGSNDLTQLTLGVDRDSSLLTGIFDERNQAVKKSMTMAIEGALKHQRHIGICGQAPSDLPEVAKFLISKGITSVSLNPDSLVEFLAKYQKD